MKTSLVKGLEKDAKEEAEVMFTQAYMFRLLVIKRLEDKVRIARSKAKDQQCYQSPNWPYLQADIIGYERAMEEVISLLLK